MPTYTYECNKCKKIFDQFLSITNMDTPIFEKCPSCSRKGYMQRIITNIRIGDPVSLGVRKADPRLRENLERMKKHHRNSTINI